MGKSSPNVAIFFNYKGVLKGREMKVVEMSLEGVGSWSEAEYSKSPEPQSSDNLADEGLISLVWLE